MPMFQPDLAAPPPAASATFSNDELVFAHVPDGPRFGDAVWDLTPLIRRTNFPDRRMNFAKIPGRWSLTIRELLMVLAQPDHPLVVEAGIVRRGRPAPVDTLVNTFVRLRTVAHWSASRGLPGPASWAQLDADLLLAALRDGSYRPDGEPVSPDTVRNYVLAIKLLRHFAPVLSGDGLGFQPWGARSATNVAEVVAPVENKTPPLSWDTWAPAVAAAWTIVDRFSADILAAAKAAESRPARAQGGTSSWAVLCSWAAEGGRVPLQTGYGRGQPKRGEPNRRLLCRQLGISNNIFKRSHKTCRPEAEALITDMARDPERSEFGGLWSPRVTVRLDGQTERPWIDEIGFGELEFFVSVLRAAGYILLASLTGMRDSELQELHRDTATISDGLPALRSVQFKGATSPDGHRRSWFAPPPVFRTIEVLAALSPHPTQLFARSAINAGAYAPQRDIPRLIDFVNASPAARPGRGHGLGLQPIRPTPAANINQVTLRRSFCVYAAQYPGAELGLGIQLGHAALRTTTGYATDSQQQVARLFSKNRQIIAREQTAAIILDAAPTAGAPTSELDTIRAQVVADPQRAARTIDNLADRYHLGFFNDCMWNEARAACGPGGPKLAEGVCRGACCGNAVFRQPHLPAVQAHIKRIDDFLDSGRGHPALLDDLGAQRTLYSRIITDIRSGSQQEGA
ncbi:hypothetical protein [Micromonospora sp. NRRL B-16802]|uniref:hypothetical protein n=1 Tax=Micromonospora sp. NRRL B-16802 TaxID=1415541 RepID=UPI0006AF2FA3|nr:hypothetical protein [Micromonospora sp. NRRL B-16802]